jgi:flagellar hook assembly protein FlgD
MKPDSRVIRFFNITNQYSGSVASIFTSIPFRKNSDNSYGTAIIYDVVGNIVKKDIKIYSCPANVHYYYFQWDGLNSNSRVVGNGSYLSIISVQDIQGQKSVLRYKIGVKSD